MILELRVLSSAVIASLLIAFPAVAKDAGLPSIDLQTICRSRAKALGETLGDRSKTEELYAGCMKSEQESKDRASCCLEGYSSASSSVLHQAP